MADEFGQFMDYIRFNIKNRKRKSPEHDAAYLNYPQLLFLAAMGAGTVFAILWLACLRPIAWDELEFLRATRWVSQGRIPYSDFWEHHTPLQWFLFAPADRLHGGPGVNAVLWLRWVQVLAWGVGLICWYRWLRKRVEPAWLVPLGVMLVPIDIPALFVPASSSRGIDPGLCTYYH